MYELERFNRDILQTATHYEALRYISDYVQRFLDKAFSGEKYTIPISVDNLLKILEIPVKEDYIFLNYKNLGSLNFYNNEPYICITPKLYEFYSNWVKIGCIAEYICLSEDILDKRKRIFSFGEKRLKVFHKYGTVSDMVAYSLMLPLKQSIEYFMEGNFIERINSKYLWKKYGELAIGYCIEGKYPIEKKTFAYHHLMQTLEAKAYLSDWKEYNKIHERILDFLDTVFMEEDKR